MLRVTKAQTELKADLQIPSESSFVKPSLTPSQSRRLCGLINTLLINTLI